MAARLAAVRFDFENSCTLHCMCRFIRIQNLSTKSNLEFLAKRQIIHFESSFCYTTDHGYNMKNERDPDGGYNKTTDIFVLANG
ncbi:hypothetical protein QQP08_007216 [Theobroma cacao]|nr:hypothetical protein QQP08_007216 [Theobroma cacao]